MKRNGELDDAQIRTKMAALHRDSIEDRVAQLLTQLFKLGWRQAT
jgi:hypothetical protein